MADGFVVDAFSDNLAEVGGDSPIVLELGQDASGEVGAFLFIVGTEEHVVDATEKDGVDGV